MDNQHRKIKGYRELSQFEIDLMNRIKAEGTALLALQTELVVYLNEQAQQRKIAAATCVDAHTEMERFHAAEPLRWAAIGKTDIQTAVMALVRAVAQPAGI